MEKTVIENNELIWDNNKVTKIQYIYDLEKLLEISKELMRNFGDKRNCQAFSKISPYSRSQGEMIHNISNLEDWFYDNETYGTYHTHGEKKYYYLYYSYVNSPQLVSLILEIINGDTNTISKFIDIKSYLLKENISETELKNKIREIFNMKEITSKEPTIVIGDYERIDKLLNYYIKVANCININKEYLNQEEINNLISIGIEQTNDYYNKDYCKTLREFSFCELDQRQAEYEEKIKEIDKPKTRKRKK